MSSVCWYFLLFTATLAWLSDAEVIITSTKSGLVFDGNQKNVKAAKPDDSEGQKWELQCQQNGHFIITNVKNDLVLDVQSGCKTGQNIIVYKKHSGPNQQFYINSDGTIGTTCNKEIILVIKDGNVETIQRSKSSGHDVHFKLVAVEEE